MTDADHGSRRDELTLGAASDSLDPTEQVELDALREGDPTVDAEIAALRRVLGRLDSLEEWDDSLPPPELADRVVAAVTGASSAPPPRRRWRAVLVAASVVLVLGGVGGALLVSGGDDAPPAAIGALGVTERVEVDDVANGVDLEAAVVPHRWGTEAIVEADGLTPGREYDLVVVEDDGVEIQAGGFLGSRQTVHCHLNAPVMRRDVALLQVRDVDGDIVGWARLPQPAG